MNVPTLAEMPRAPRTEREAWTLAEVQPSVARADRDRHAALRRVALSTGLRRGELPGES